jgi:hypothetical protein
MVSMGTIHAIKGKRIWKHVWEFYEDRVWDYRKTWNGKNT